MKRTKGRFRAVRAAAILGAVGMVVLPSAARADDFNWKTSVPTGNWSVGTNWTDFEHPSTLGPPTGGNNAYIGSGDSVTENLSNPSVANLYLGYQWGGTGTLQNSSGGTLTIANGFEINTSGNITANNGSSIAGSDVAIVANGTIDIGLSGAASNLNLTNSSQVDAPVINFSDNAIVTLNSGSTIQGSNSTPAVTVSGGAIVNLENQSSIVTSQGNLTVDSGASIALSNQSEIGAGFLEVGASSAATLTIDSTSNVGAADVGIDNGGSIFVNGGFLDATQLFYQTNGGAGAIQVGNNGTGASLNVNSGGEVDCFILGATNDSSVTVNSGGNITVDPGGEVELLNGAAVSIVGGSSILLENGSSLNAFGGDVKIGGGSGAGTLTVEGGSRLFADQLEMNGDNTSTALVDGQDSVVSVNVLVAAGNLTIQNGATFSDTTGLIADGGVTTVSGAMTTWASGGSIAVGYSGYGAGTLLAQSGAAVSSGGTVMDDFGSTITITGTGAYGGATSLTAATGLYVGYSGTASLTIQNGGYVSDLNGFVGYLPGSDGNVLVSDPGTIWANTQGLLVNDGTLTIQNSATVTAASGSASGSGVLKIKTGGSLAVSGSFSNSTTINNSGFASFGSLTGSGTFNNGGTLTMTPSFSGVLGNTVAGTGALIMNGAGTLVVTSSNPSLAAAVSVNSGTMQLGNSSALGSSSLNIGAAGTVDVNGTNLSVTKLTGSGVLDNLTAGGTTTLTVTNSASSTFFGSIRNSSGLMNLTAAGAGTLTLAGNNSYSGTTTVNSGAKLALNSTGALPVEGTVVNNGSLLVNADTIAGHVTGSGTSIVAPGVIFTTDFTQNALVNNGTTSLDGQSSIGIVTGSGNLIIGAGASVALGANSANTTGSLSLGSASTLDLNNGSLAINFGASTDPASTIAGYLATAYTAGTWTGPGITSSVAAAAVAASHSPILSVGYADGNTDTATAASLDQVLVRLTLAGDANLDGNVDFNDLFAVGKRLNTTGNDWANGNFNYSSIGAVDFNDLFIIGQNLNQTINAAVEDGGTTVAIGQSAAVQVNDTIVSVPEPAAFCLLATCGAGLVARRRRRGCSL